MKTVTSFYRLTEEEKKQLLRQYAKEAALKEPAKRKRILRNGAVCSETLRGEQTANPPYTGNTGMRGYSCREKIRM